MEIDKDKLKQHENHDVVMAVYRDDDNTTYNVAIECQDCYEVIADVEL